MKEPQLRPHYNPKAKVKNLELYQSQYKFRVAKLPNPDAGR